MGAHHTGAVQPQPRCLAVEELILSRTRPLCRHGHIARRQTSSVKSLEQSRNPYLAARIYFALVPHRPSGQSGLPQSDHRDPAVHTGLSHEGQLVLRGRTGRRRS